MKFHLYLTIRQTCRKTVYRFRQQSRKVSKEPGKDNVFATQSAIPNRQGLLFPVPGTPVPRCWEQKSLPVGNNTACDVNPV